MPRPQSPKRKEAYDMWIASDKKMLLKEIAKRLEVSESQIRNWKQKDSWDKVAQSNDVASKSGATKRRGGQKGNRNAVGHGAPLGNKNRLKHGAFERFAFEHMFEDEIEVANDTELDSIEDELKNTLAFLKAKELRLMKRIQSVRQLNTRNLMINSVSKTKTEKLYGVFKEDENGNLVKDKGTGFFDGERSDTTVTNTTSVEEALNRLESELDKTQAKKLKVLAQLDKMKIDRERLEIERIRALGENEQSKLANEWVEALLSSENGDDPDE
ncbi:MAG: phage terminase small subunit [Alphaproteobacteria bacterium]|nr:phage terminase small subunit [Alphaproteobacteria bacterium]